MVDDEDFELVVGPGEGLVDKLVVLAPHPPVVEVRLRGIDADHDGVLEVHDRVPFPEQTLEVDVAHVARVVVAGDDHDPLARYAPQVLGRLLELLAVTSIREVTRHHHGGRVQVVYLQDRALQKVGYKVRTSAVDVADLADNHPTLRAH